MINLAVVRAVEELRRPDGLLKIKDIIEAARATTSPLHPYFTWDTTRAVYVCHQVEARRLIRSVIEYKQFERGGEPVTMKIRTYCSLWPDRILPGGGYRSMVEILGKPGLRDQRLADLILELQRIQTKCQEFQELRRIVMAIDEIVPKRPPRSVRPRRDLGGTAAT